jgi:hypothetical protein
MKRQKPFLVNPKPLMVALYHAFNGRYLGGGVWAYCGRIVPCLGLDDGKPTAQDKGASKEVPRATLTGSATCESRCGKKQA